MCGRARLSSDVSEIKIAFGILPERPTPNFPPSWNVAPTDPLPIVRFDAKEKQRTLETAFEHYLDNFPVTDAFEMIEAVFRRAVRRHRSTLQ